jgi:peptidoglycan-N-acetylglucosamine deacetylase
MRMISPPAALRKLWPGALWKLNTQEKVLYFTFDDGPIPGVTAFVLDTLQQFNAKATFFMVGQNVGKHPDVYERILKEQHGIGNHTEHHLNAWHCSGKQYFDDVEECNKRLHSRMFRPPYGKLKFLQGVKLRQAGYRLVMWDVLSYDFDSRVSPVQCAQHVISRASEGSIIVFHDSVKAKRNLEYALPKCLEHFAHAGYRFEALDRTK